MMKNTLILVLFPLFAIARVGVVVLKSVFVKEGDSVTLHTGVQIQGNDQIEWRLKENLLFRILSSGGNITVTDKTDGTFGVGLKLDNTTGDLKITNFRNTDAGEYKLKIRGSKSSDTTFSVTGVLNTDRDPVKSVTVGESITLNTQIQSDEVKWRFGAENTLIAEISLMADRIPQYHDVPDGRFRDRLKLDEHTGSLTIMNIRDTDSGVYKADIRSSSFTIHKTFTVAVRGVFTNETDGVKTVTAKNGESVFLNTLVTEIQQADLMEWLFGPQNIIIAKTDGKSNSPSYTNNDVRFENRLNLDIQTGRLTIKNSNRGDSGLYQLKIIKSTFTIQKRFSVTVSGLSPGEIAGIVVSVLLLIAAVVGGVMIYLWKKSTAKQRKSVRYYCCWRSKAERRKMNGQNRTVKEEETELSK